MSRAAAVLAGGLAAVCAVTTAACVRHGFAGLAAVGVLLALFCASRAVTWWRR